MAGSESLRALRVRLRARLQARRPELEQAVLTRVYAVSAADLPADPEYVDGLRAAVSAAIEYSLDLLEGGEEEPPTVPAALLGQARIAARNGIGLDTVLRRYFAGYTLLGDFLIEEAEKDGSPPKSLLKHILRTQAALFDRLVIAVTNEYSREATTRLHTPEQRRARRVERLLEGELIDTSEIAYDLDATHVGALAVGSEASVIARSVADALDCRLMLVSRPENLVWGWYGAHRRLDTAEIEQLFAPRAGSDLVVAVGEPARGLIGWRLTHQQAKTALRVAVRRSEGFARYADVALLGSILQDDLLATSLRRLYLAPLERERDGGETARQTLRAYFAAGRNASSAAALLDVTRRTVTNRLHSIEELLGHSLDGVELQVALDLDELSDSGAAHRTR